MHDPTGPAVITASDITAFRSAVDDSFVPLQVSAPAHVRRFHGTIRGTGIDDVHFTDVTASPHTVERTPALIARGERSFFKLSLMLAGSALLIQDKREAVLRPGDLAIYDTDRPYTLTFDEDFRTLVLMFPRTALGLPPELVAQLAALRISGTQGLGAVVSPYLAQLGDHLEQLTGSVGARLAQSSLDLVTSVFTRELGLDERANNPQLALMHRIRTHISSHLEDPDLGPSSIAAAHFISTRHLHGLFHEDGTTVSTWIRRQRLDRCRRDLRDPMLADVPVAAIAARRGFSDAAHFSRVFKAEFGVSPSEYRATR